MTTPEHTLVGVHFAIASGAFHRYGIPALVLAGLVSNLPDLDGLPMLVDMARFESGHRVWGHNITAILLSSVILALLQFRFDVFGTIAASLSRRFATSDTATVRSVKRLTSFTVIPLALCCQALHLPCDMVVSGGQGLSDWHVRPWWPFSSIGYVYPMIPWGDPGPTIVLMIGVILAVKHPAHCQKLSVLSLVVLVLYLILRRGLLTT